MRGSRRLPEVRLPFDRYMRRDPPAVGSGAGAARSRPGPGPTALETATYTQRRFFHAVSAPVAIHARGRGVARVAGSSIPPMAWAPRRHGHPRTSPCARAAQRLRAAGIMDQRASSGARHVRPAVPSVARRWQPARRQRRRELRPAAAGRAIRQLIRPDRSTRRARCTAERVPRTSAISLPAKAASTGCLPTACSAAAQAPTSRA
jgi:hypothetical protein